MPRTPTVNSCSNRRRRGAFRTRGGALGPALCATLALAGCGDDDGAMPPVDAGIDAPAPVDAGPPPDWTLAEPPASDVPETGVRRDVFVVPGVAAPPNPTTGTATPSELQATQVVRYREDVATPKPARAIVVAYPGTFGGAGSYDALARALVLRGAASGETTEVWAIDRRSNLLEDLRGMATATVAGNPEIAQGYYYRSDTIDGAAFAGFRTQDSVDFMSEWGLATLLEDVRRVIALVPEGDRVGHVFLMGHSAGAGVAETYAAWRFGEGAEARRGAEELAGVILVDGASQGEAITEDGVSRGDERGLRAARRARRATRRGAALPRAAAARRRRARDRADHVAARAHVARGGERGPRARPRARDALLDPARRGAGLHEPRGARLRLRRRIERNPRVLLLARQADGRADRHEGRALRDARLPDGQRGDVRLDRRARRDAARVHARRQPRALVGRRPHELRRLVLPAAAPARSGRRGRERARRGLVAGGRRAARLRRPAHGRARARRRRGAHGRGRLRRRCAPASRRPSAQGARWRASVVARRARTPPASASSTHARSRTSTRSPRRIRP